MYCFVHILLDFFRTAKEHREGGRKGGGGGGEEEERREEDEEEEEERRWERRGEAMDRIHGHN